MYSPCTILTTADIVSVATSANRHGEEDGSGRFLEHLVSNLTLLRDTFYGLPEEAVRFTTQFRLLPRLFTTLVTASLDQTVRSSNTVYPSHCSLSFSSSGLTT